MNNDDPVSDSEHDDDLSQVKKLLLRIEPSTASRVKNRQVIATELAAFKKSLSLSPWWRRSVPVPVPVAMGTCAALLALMLFSLAGLEVAPGEVGSTNGQLTIEDHPLTNSVPEPIDELSFGTAQVDYEASETYLCGIGRIEYESLYQLKEK